MKHYYLDKINYDNFDYHLKDDKREKEWRKQRRKYGFDERETWNLNWRFYAWLYERLKMYKKVANILLPDYNLTEDNEVEGDETLEFLVSNLINYSKKRKKSN